MLISALGALRLCQPMDLRDRGATLVAKFPASKLIMSAVLTTLVINDINTVNKSDTDGVHDAAVYA